MANSALSSSFFLAMLAIIVVCRIVGWSAQRLLGQPQVVGEMIAGVVLGPSLLGWLVPPAEALLFPPAVRPLLYVGAQFGVGLYMFLIGLTFDRDEFRSAARGAVAVSLAGMVAPLAVGAAMAPWMLGLPGLFAPHVGPVQAAFFLGAAIAITAFPMMARIIHERGLAGTRLGTLTLAAGAVGDAGAWIVVAIVLASLGGSQSAAGWTVGGGVGFAAVMILLAPRALRPLGRIAERDGVDERLVACGLALFLLCAWAMDGIGMHAVFGGFLLGTAMPRGRLTQELAAKLEPLTVTFLLPMFFTFSGLNTDLLVLGHGGLWLVALAVLVAAVAAKGGACYAAARLTGADHQTAFGMGALMNARGLMELIIINIGLAHHVIGPALFAMLVLMAIATTLMASPLFAWGARGNPRPALTPSPLR